MICRSEILGGAPELAELGMGAQTNRHLNQTRLARLQRQHPGHH